MDITGISDMYKIKPFHEHIQTELINYIKNAPDHWQAIVLACLSFSEINSFDEIISKTNLSPIYTLKALIISEKFHVTIYINDGWIMNKKLDSDSLNEYLAIDIAESEVSNDWRMSRLIDMLSTKVQNIDSLNIAKENKTHFSNKTTETVQKAESRQATIGSSYIKDISELNLERPIEGSGRKKSKEWNNNTAIEYNREIRDAIEKRKNDSSVKITESKEISVPLKTPTKDEEKAERLFAKLCTNYPDYDAYITRCHQKDPSYKQMKLVEEKIKNDYLEEERQNLNSNEH